MRVPQSGPEGFEMFCPKCATQNVEGASYCRSCGANISLIPNALTGSLPQASAPDDLRSRLRGKRDREVEPSLERGIMNIFVGLGFIVAALAVMFRFPAGIFWGWSFFIPGFSNLGKGVASIVAARRVASMNAQLRTGTSGQFFPNPVGSPGSATGVESGVQSTGRLMTPVPSVTEGTTRHLGTEAPTRHFDETGGEEKLR
jgi:hypothetical protein